MTVADSCVILLTLESLRMLSTSLTAKPRTRFMRTTDMSITKHTKITLVSQNVSSLAKLSVKSYSPISIVRTCKNIFLRTFFRSSITEGF